MKRWNNTTRSSRTIYENIRGETRGRAITKEKHAIKGRTKEEK